jgi:hypothetical protein
MAGPSLASVLWKGGIGSMEHKSTSAEGSAKFLCRFASAARRRLLASAYGDCSIRSHFFAACVGWEHSIVVRASSPSFGVRRLAAAFPARACSRTFAVVPKIGRIWRPASWPEAKRQQAAALQNLREREAPATAGETPALQLRFLLRRLK